MTARSLHSASGHTIESATSTRLRRLNVVVMLSAAKHLAAAATHRLVPLGYRRCLQELPLACGERVPFFTAGILPFAPAGPAARFAPLLRRSAPPKKGTKERRPPARRPLRGCVRRRPVPRWCIPAPARHGRDPSRPSCGPFGRRRTAARGERAPARERPAMEGRAGHAVPGTDGCYVPALDRPRLYAGVCSAAFNPLRRGGRRRDQPAGRAQEMRSRAARQGWRSARPAGSREPAQRARPQGAVSLATFFQKKVARSAAAERNETVCRWRNHNQMLRCTDPSLCSG